MAKRTLAFFIITVLTCSWIQAEEDDPRRIWAEAYTKKVEQKAPVKRAKKREYKTATPQIVADAVVPETVVGITIWRFRTAYEGEEGVMIENERMIAERVDAGTPLAAGDKIRISIEAARDGYLYVIDREQYSDGTTGDPYLIFPTSRLAGGENKTTVGRVFSIPAKSDQPPYFTLTPGRTDQTGELISVLVTPEPMQNLAIAKQEVQISNLQVSDWEKKWGNTVGRLEMEGGAGQMITQMEHEAGIGARLLKHTDPPPQSIYYNPSASAADPVFININLQIAR